MGRRLISTDRSCNHPGHLSDAIRVKLKAILLKVLKSLNRGHPTLRRKLSFGDSNGEKVRDAYNICVAEEFFFFPFSCRLLFCHMWQEKVGLSWKWGWAGTSQFPWIVSCLCCHRASRKTCLTCLITSLKAAGHGGECSLGMPSAPAFPPAEWPAKRQHTRTTWTSPCNLDVTGRMSTAVCSVSTAAHHYFCRLVNSYGWRKKTPEPEPV